MIKRGKSAFYTRIHSVSALDDVPDAIRRKLWLDTDRTYRAAARRLIEIKSNQEVKLKQADDSADFSSDPPSVHDEQPPRLRPLDEEWATRLRKWSATLANNLGLLSSTAALVCGKRDQVI